VNRENIVDSPLLVFLCGSRDFHAIDWYRTAKKNLPNKEVWILTDLISAEGFKVLITDQDSIHKLIIIDRFLFNYQSTFGNIWRNFIKILVFPLQVFLIRIFSHRHPEAVYFCHSMYYLCLAWASGVRYVGTPQGSDILIKPFRSIIYKYFSVKALKSAINVTVDSKAMSDKVYELAGVKAITIQNGIDVRSISTYLEQNKFNSFEKLHILSIRGFTELYRINEIINARNRSILYSKIPINFLYPFYETTYRADSMKFSEFFDEDIGRLDGANMYELILRARLVVSIPRSDSSPKSVYEAIFCGCPVAITYHQYYDNLPECMKARVILVDLSDNDWFDKAVRQADVIANTAYLPSNEAVVKFDKFKSFNMISKLLFPNSCQ
jgi:hypothetical protein